MPSQASRQAPGEPGSTKMKVAPATPPVILEGTREDVVRIDYTHGGRAGEADIQLEVFQLVFEDATTSTEILST